MTQNVINDVADKLAGGGKLVVRHNKKNILTWKRNG